MAFNINLIYFTYNTKNKIGKEFKFMEERQTKNVKFITKETIIAAIIGLIIGIGITALVVLCMDCFAKSAGIAKLKYGEDTIATVAGKVIKTDSLYQKIKKIDGLDLLINQIDQAILDDMYTLTNDEKEQAKEEADSCIEYYTQTGLTEETFLSRYGFANYDEFLAYIETNAKSKKYLYDYLEKKLEEGAVDKYYEENKDNIETYDSEHILVKISDTVTDEQALALANEIIGKLNEGKSFDEVVKEYGDRIVHEELGFQGKSSNLEQTYIDELVALKDGEYSKTPIKTSYGYHIVHRLKTATKEDLRGTIIETLSTDLLTNDSNLTYKAFVELRKENNLTIFDEDINKQYEEYCEKVYETNS